MATPTRLRSRTTKPSLGAQLNWGHPLARGLVGLWTFSEGAGKVAQDSAGLAAGTMVGGAILVPGGASFSASGDKVTAASAKRLPTGAQPRTVGIWFQHTVSGHGTVISYGTQGTRQSFGLKSLSETNQLQFWAYGDDTSWAQTWDSSQSHFFAVTYDGATGIIAYYDGRQVGTATLGGVLNTVVDVNGLVIADDYFQVTNQFVGVVGSASIYDRALTATEIRQLFLEPFVIFQPAAPKGLWLVNTAAGAVSRTTVDAPTTSESLTRLANLLRTLSEAPSTSESATRLGTFLRSVADAPATNEAVTRSLAANRSVTEAPSSSESLARSGTFGRTVADAPTTSESAVRSIAAKRTVVDAPTTSESVSRALNVGRSTTDALTTSESVTRNVGLNRTATETPTLSESIARVNAAKRATTEAPTTADVAFRVVTVGRTATDAPTTSDTAAVLKSAARNTTEAVAISEAMARTGLFYRVDAEAVATTDVATRTIVGGGPPSRATSESVSTTDVAVATLISGTVQQRRHGGPPRAAAGIIGQTGARRVGVRRRPQSVSAFAIEYLTVSDAAVAVVEFTDDEAVLEAMLGL